MVESKERSFRIESVKILGRYGAIRNRQATERICRRVVAFVVDEVDAFNVAFLQRLKVRKNRLERR